eukprot:753516-Hanusia_phi.AAC.2
MPRNFGVVSKGSSPRRAGPTPHPLSSTIAEPSPRLPPRLKLAATDQIHQPTPPNLYQHPSS